MICNICSVPTNWAWNTNTHQMKLETKLLSNEIPYKSKAQNTEQCKQLLVQSVPITTKVVSSNPVHGEVYTIQHLGDNCIVFENFTASIGDLMVAN
jgi:hypothetical protein